MAKRSAGILLYRWREGELELLLVHPGGPFWAKRDAGAWSIPKGEVETGADPLQAARREFREELGASVQGTPCALGEVTQKGGKRVAAWAVEGDFDPAELRSNTFSLEWPPGSGRKREFPEVDRAEWFPPDAAREKLNPAQVPFVERLLRLLERDSSAGGPPGPPEPGRGRRPETDSIIRPEDEG